MVRTLGTIWLVAGLTGCEPRIVFDNPCDPLVDASVPCVISSPKVTVGGACKAADDLSRLEFSLILSSGTVPLGPDGLVDGEPLDGLLGPESFSFGPSPSRSEVAFDAPAIAISEEGGAPAGVQLDPTTLSYVYPGGAGRRQDPRLVVLMLDHSGSLVGVEPTTNVFDPALASDPSDQRIAFFRQLVEQISDDHLLSLISFSGDFANITPMYSTPARNKSVILEGLEHLRSEESGTTPLTRALNDARTRVIEPNGAMNPVVVLFTDGVEGGDPTDGDGGFEAAIAAYGERTGEDSIPVIVVHLQSPAGAPVAQRGRSASLAKLACRTGGAYIFLPHADSFTSDPWLLSTVLGRVAGAWRLTVESSLSDPDFDRGPWFVSSRLTMTLAGHEVSFDLQDTDGADGGSTDTRAWFIKE